MRALVVDHSAAGHLRMAEVADPQPAPHQVLVRVTAVSLNFGEIRRLPGTPEPTVPGWDAAGVVVKAAADGSGPGVGTPVVTLGARGAWAQLRAVDAEAVGVVPDKADLHAVSTVPVAATTALRALRRIEPLLGRRVLVVGASGGVGGFAVQLASRAGARVVATTGDPTQVEGLRALGAHEVVGSPDEVDVPVHGVLDMVGGPFLVSAYARLRGGGTLVAVGHSAHAAEVFPYGALFADETTHDRCVTSFFLLAMRDFADDLTWLARQVAGGELDPHITWRGNWREVADAADALVGRRLHGKAVLEVDQE